MTKSDADAVSLGKTTNAHAAAVKVAEDEASLGIADVDELAIAKAHVGVYAWKKTPKHGWDPIFGELRIVRQLFICYMLYGLIFCMYTNSW